MKIPKILNNWNDPVYLIDVNSLVIVDVNKKAIQELGYLREEFVGQHISLIKPLDTGYQKVIDNLVDDPNYSNIRSFHQRKDGSIFPVLINANVYSQGGKSFSLSIVQNIEQKIRSETNAEELGNRYETLYKISANGIVIIDKDARIISINPAMEKMCGYKEEEIKLKNLNVVFPLELSNNLYKKIGSKIKFPKRRAKDFPEAVIFKKNKKNVYVEVGLEHFLENEEDRIILSLTDNTKKNREEQVKLNALLKGVDDERERFSRELHDGVSQSLISIAMFSEKFVSRYSIDLSDKLVVMVKDAVAELKSISKNISPPNIKYFGAIESIKTLVINFSYQTGIKSECIVFEVDDGDLGSNALFVYRIIQEAINNISKHAKATSVQIQLVNIGNEKIRIMIEDDGVGFKYDRVRRKTQSFGLNNIEYRVKALKGNCTFDSSPQHGTTICIDFPKFK